MRTCTISAYLKHLLSQHVAVTAAVAMLVGVTGILSSRMFIGQVQTEVFPKTLSDGSLVVDDNGNFDKCGNPYGQLNGGSQGDACKGADHFRLFGTWKKVIGSGYQNDSRVSVIDGAFTNYYTASWTFDGLILGRTYDVYATWPVQQGATKKAHLHLNNFVDMTVKPVGEKIDGAVWQKIGTTINTVPGPMTIQGSTEDGKKFVADAVRLVIHPNDLDVAVVSLDAPKMALFNGSYVHYSVTATYKNQGKETAVIDPKVTFTLPEGALLSGIGITQGANLICRQNGTTVTCSASPRGPIPLLGLGQPKVDTGNLLMPGTTGSVTIGLVFYGSCTAGSRRVSAQVSFTGEDVQPGNETSDATTTVRCDLPVPPR